MTILGANGLVAVALGRLLFGAYSPVMDEQSPWPHGCAGGDTTSRKEKYLRMSRGTYEVPGGATKEGEGKQELNSRRGERNNTREKNNEVK